MALNLGLGTLIRTETSLLEKGLADSTRDKINNESRKDNNRTIVLHQEEKIQKQEKS